MSRSLGLNQKTQFIMCKLGPLYFATSQYQATMFQKPQAPSNSSVNSSTLESASIHSGHGSPSFQGAVTNESPSIISRTLTATSVNSHSTVNTTFETNWMPNSFVVSRKKYSISLKLKPNEISLLRKSWTIVTSNDSRAANENLLERSISRQSSTSNLRLTVTTTNNSMGSNMTTGTTGTKPGSVVGNSHGGPGFNTASFSSYLFCIQFYNNLIGMDPEIERLIPSIRHQASAFAGVIQVAIDTLEDLSKMKESLLNLGHLHARILGIDSPYFKTMGDALIKTFQDWFGNSPESFPLELEEAWIKLYCFLANSIIQGGIDPIIEYNIQPANKMVTNTNTDNMNEEAEESEEEESEAEKYDSIAEMGTSFASSSSLGKKSTPKHTPSSYSKYEPSLSPPAPKPVYSASVSGSRLNRLKKTKNGTKEDCTIM